VQQQQHQPPLLRPTNNQRILLQWERRLGSENFYFCHKKRAAMQDLWLCAEFWASSRAEKKKLSSGHKELK